MMNPNCIPPFPESELICQVDAPLTWTNEKTAQFVRACREMALFHQKNNPEIAFLYRKHCFHPEAIQSEKDLRSIPVLGVTAMKYFLITTLPHELAFLKLTSSGTRGQKTRIWFDEGSLSRCQAMLESYWAQEGFVSNEQTNYLMFVYHPSDAKDLGISFSETNQQRFAPVADSFYAIRKTNSGAWEFQLQDTRERARHYAEDGKPVRIFGLPSFMYEFLLEAQKHHPIPLPPGSLIQMGGGWKAAEAKRITRAQFRALATETLGIPADRIRDNYGMAEHCAPYMECKNHRFHIGAYSRVIVRDPATLEELPHGQTGLLELITPFNAMMPNLALLTTDVGFIDEEACLCGWNSPTFTLLGRGGISKHKGCALQAEEIVNRGGGV